MSQVAQTQPKTWNIANQVTVARLVASLFLFIALAFHQYWLSLILFILGATTDWLDGYLARSRNLVTKLGRILDPLADKIIICGTFIYLSAISGSLIPAWMTVVVVVREMVVTVLRSFLEQEGHDFSAKMPGKIKMVLQCAAVIASLLMLATRNADGEAAIAWLPGLVTPIAWAMAVSTIYSGVLYIPAAIRLLGGTK